MASLSPLPSGAAILCLKPHGETQELLICLWGTPLASLQTGMFSICPTTGGSQLHVQENKPKGNPPVGQKKLHVVMTKTKLKLYQRWISPNP